MPRNRDDWNLLESVIRSSSHSLLGMNSTYGANEIRKLAKLIYRHMKIHKDRDRTIAYIHTKLTDLRGTGFIEAMGSDALVGLFGLLKPMWNLTEVEPIESQDILRYGEQSCASIQSTTHRNSSHADSVEAKSSHSSLGSRSSYLETCVLYSRSRV